MHNQGKLQLSLLSAEVFSGEFQMPRRSIHEGQVSCDVSADEQDDTHILCSNEDQRFTQIAWSAEFTNLKC